MYLPNVQAASLGPLRAPAPGAHGISNTDLYVAATTPSITSRYVVDSSALSDSPSNTAGNCPSQWSWNSTAKVCQNTQNDGNILERRGGSMIIVAAVVVGFLLLTLIYGFCSGRSKSTPDDSTEYSPSTPPASSNIKRTNIRNSTRSSPRASPGISARISTTRHSAQAVGRERYTTISPSYRSSSRFNHSRSWNANRVFAPTQRNAVSPRPVREHHSSETSTNITPSFVFASSSSHSLEDTRRWSPPPSQPIPIQTTSAHAPPVYVSPESRSSQDGTPPPLYRVRAREGEHVYKASDVVAPPPAYRKD